MIHLYVGYESFTCGAFVCRTWLTYMCNMKTQTCNMTHSNETRFVHMWHVWHDLLQKSPTKETYIIGKRPLVKSGGRVRFCCLRVSIPLCSLQTGVVHLRVLHFAERHTAAQELYEYSSWLFVVLLCYTVLYRHTAAQCCNTLQHTATHSAT